jgi:hypothetical protein
LGLEADSIDREKEVQEKLIKLDIGFEEDRFDREKEVQEKLIKEQVEKNEKKKQDDLSEKTPATLAHESSEDGTVGEEAAKGGTLFSFFQEKLIKEQVEINEKKKQDQNVFK